MRELHLAPAERAAKAEGEGSPAHRRALAAAYDALSGPEFPEDLAHLYEWSLELAGAERLSYTEIRDWAILTHRAPSALEVSALMQINVAMRARVDVTAPEAA